MGAFLASIGSIDYIYIVVSAMHLRQLVAQSHNQLGIQNPELPNLVQFVLIIVG